ncbi:MULTISPECIES: extracellular solute-binding protein [Desulfococcus]|uniref:Extracellular solute-binding protein n=1 Tax=Desulfococcus multivorans DSM 2059 TaxID=1121405 RepID=S7VDP0_DESML|nr:extracellular solute-binding protein [Desulfococcus multivorans]AOY58352.1 extracellular solute-binding protein [Desulfococcus multivorans]AQV00684.1 ABC transporter substrate-binding protein [Desulfococcus multivorans]EPR42573.1 extracellular solute-binding protein [Desulfococcus multivorans DSM 2059]SKA18417.1 multiple sugar transport system substrate-binding protein [Desulfococcus multivorans DSM 2059]
MHWSIRNITARLALAGPLPRLFLLAYIAMISGCGDATAPERNTVLDAWAHAGQELERSTLVDQVLRFNAAHRDLRVRLTLIPEGSYNAQVQAAAAAGELPDLLEFDGPFLYGYVWQGRLQPVDRLLTPHLLSDLIPSIIAQGTYHGRLWSVGAFDSGLGLYADRTRLARAGIPIPTPARPWTSLEFTEILDRLAADDPDGQVLDLKLNYAGEWYTYAFSPLIQSAGGDLVERNGSGRATGILNGPETVRAMTIVQDWIISGRVDPNIDDAAFITGRTALAMGGHWNWSQYREHLGRDLLLLPLPDFGRGPRTGQGSWSWAVTADSLNPEAASRFLSFLLRPEEVLAITRANGAVPATRSAVSRSRDYRPGGPLHIFVEQLETGAAIPRPRTPAYPVITAAFQKSFDRIRSGGDVQAALDRAARMIDLEIEDNQGYPLIGRGREEAMR